MVFQKNSWLEFVLKRAKDSCEFSFRRLQNHRLFMNGELAVQQLQEMQKDAISVSLH